MRVKGQLRCLVSVVFMLLLLTTGSWGMEINDAPALGGLQEGKGVFLVNSDNPEKTALYLEIIKGTYLSMAQQQVKPDFIVVFIGPTVRFLTTEPGAELAAHKEALTAITASVKALGDLGVALEICAIATDFFKVPNNKLLPELNLVANGFNSLIGYQNKGYGLVPIL